MTDRPYLQPRHFVIPPDAREKAAEVMDHLGHSIGPRAALTMLRTWMLALSIVIIGGYVIGLAWLISKVDVDYWHEPYVVAIGLIPVALHTWQSIRAVTWAWSIRLAEDDR